MKDEKDVKKLLDKLDKVDYCYKTDNEEIVLKNLITRIISDIDKDHCDSYLNRIPILERAVLVLLKKALKEKEDKNLRPLISSLENPLPPYDGPAPSMSGNIGACICQPTRPATEEEIQFWDAKRKEWREYEEWKKRKEKEKKR